MSTLLAVELGVLGPLQVRRDGTPVTIPGAKPRAILTMLGLHDGSIVSTETLIELLWGDDPPRTAAKALQTHISSLRRTLGDGFVLTEGMGWILSTTETDASRYQRATKMGRDAAAAGDTTQAVARFEEALTLWRGTPELPDSRRGISEKTRWIEGHAALVEDRADALLATGRAAEIIGELEAAVADAPLRERRWGQLMLALYRAGRQGEALGAYQRARSLLADELGVDPGPELRRLEAAIVAQDAALEIPVAQHLPAVTRAVTFLLTDIEGSTAAWEADADAMAVALARHDELVEQVVTSRGGRLIKARGEGDATFSVFERPSAGAAAAIELQDAILHEPWELLEPMRIRVALHTGEAELRDGDYFGRAVNRAARLRSLAVGGQILCSGATAELVIDSLPDDVALADLGMRQLRNLARPEHVFELRLEAADEGPPAQTTDAPLERPSLPAVLTGPGPFVGRERELERLLSAWQGALVGGIGAVLIAGEPGVGKTRLAGEWSRQAFEQGAVVLYGRCDEDLGAPYQPFAEALRSLAPCLGTTRLRALRGVEALLPLIPGLTDVLPDLAAPTRADPDTERYALFDAVVALLELTSASAPVVLILDDLHWAAKPTLLLLRHLLRFGEHTRVQVVGIYRSTDLDRSHPLAAMLADLHRDGIANRLQLSGLDEDDVSAYVAEAGYDDEELARALASVTAGNPFFLIEALRHVDESGGVWDPSTLPQGVRETVSRRLSRLPAETNTALAAAAVVGIRFALDLVERVVDQDLVDAFDEACKAGIVIEEPGGRYRFNHAIVRQSLLAELPSVRRMRLHQRIAATLESEPGADDELLAELAHHYFECAWAGNAVKAVEYCGRAADQAMARLAYEGAADLYDHALHALEEIDDELPDRDEQVAELLIARCEALLAAGDVTSAAGAVSQLQSATVDSARLAAWATCFDGQLSMLIHPERLEEVEAAVGAAAHKLAELDDAAGEAQAHTVRAACLARLGRIGDCEIALDDALTAARRARKHTRVNAVLAGAPLAALWGPNPVPRAGGRCLDVVRLLRITTDSPAVEATSTRCQAVLEAFRGRAAAARRMIDSARRTVTELGLRHALLEVEEFAGVVELIVDDPASAEPHLRKAYNGFRRMGIDVCTAETAALLGRACLVLDRDAEADELCSESERLAGNALKASISWRTLRAQLLSRRGDHEEARRFAEAAVGLAERTDALVDHGDACLALATVLGAAGDVTGSRVAAERAVDLYERKGAAALAEKARRVLGERDLPAAPAAPETPQVKLDTAAARASERVMAAIDRGAWDEFEGLFDPEGTVESRRRVVGFKQTEFPADEVMHQTRRDLETGAMRANHVVIAVRGERLALARMVLSTADVSPGAPRDEFLQLYGIDDKGRIALQVWFDLEDMDAAMAELDAMHARFEEKQRPAARRLENAASRITKRLQAHFAARDWAALIETLADDVFIDDRQRVVNAGIQRGRDAALQDARVNAELGVRDTTSTVIATRGERLVLRRTRYSGAGFHTDTVTVFEIAGDDRVVAQLVFDPDDFDAALAELDARYLAGEAAAHANTWSVVAGCFSSISRHELPALTPDCISIDHRRVTAFAPGELNAYIHAGWDLDQNVRTYVEVVHRLSDLGAVCTYVAHVFSHEGFDGEWRGVNVATVRGNKVNRSELFDEADLDAAIARFDELSRPAQRLYNAASRITERLQAHFAAHDWAALTEMLADDVFIDDRRRVVNAGLQRGRDAALQDARVNADLGVRDTTSTVIATRGERLVLRRTQYSGKAFQIDIVTVFEIGRDHRVVAQVVFDFDDFDAAIAELDARYLAGEAAAHAHTWSLIAGGHAALSRQELPPIASDCVSIDHRQGAALVPGDLTAYFRAGWDLDQNIRSYVEVVHRLSDLGAVCTHAAHGISREGFDAEWRVIDVLTVEGDRIGRCEVFDEADPEAAIARFEQLSRPAPRLENAASQVSERFWSCFATRNWDAITQVLAGDFSSDDRRRGVGAGVQHGRDAQVADMRTAANVGFTSLTPTVVAIRGSRLVLTHLQVSGSDPEAIQNDALLVTEIDADERIVALVVFQLEDFEAAMAELDARYLSGEAAAHAHTWSIIVNSFSLLSHGELPPMTTDSLTVDHRRAAAFAPGEGAAYFRASWELAKDLNVYIEAVHRLSDLGAVFTHVGKGTSREGFDAEWRTVDVNTVEGDLISRGELFDETDLDAALAKFEELIRVPRRLENAASRVADRFSTCYVTGDWEGMAEVLADNYSSDDRRRVVNSGVRRGRDAHIADMRARAELWTNRTSTVVATRGERLALTRTGLWDRDQGPQAFVTELFIVHEINADERLVAGAAFDLDDFDSAIAELDARYLAGEAAAHAHTWSVIAGTFAALSRDELPTMTPDCVTIDHRRATAFAPGELTAYIHAAWDLEQNIRTYVEVVHRLSDLGAVCTYAAHAVSREGFDGEWQEISVTTVEGDLVKHCELFDEADLDAALARFDELSQPVRRLENAASQSYERFRAYFAARDWAAMAELLTADTSVDDHRRVVNAEIRRGRDVEIANMRAFAEIGATKSTATVIATRGERLVLCRTRISGEDDQPGGFGIEMLIIVETAADKRIQARVAYDPDNVDAAFEELDARYLAGEAAPYSRTWSLMAQIHATLNRHEIHPRTPDGVNIDHRRGIGFAPGDTVRYASDAFDDMPDATFHIVAVHRLSDLGAVITQAIHGTSRNGLEAEWQHIALYTFEGDLVDRCEIFDEADLDAALARFEDLHPQAPRLENAASRVEQRFSAYFAARDWDAVAETTADAMCVDDRRRVVNAGVRHGRDAQIANLRAMADIGITNITSTVIAIRGERLALTRLSNRGLRHAQFGVELLAVVEIDADNKLVAHIAFDPDDFDAAIAELDARYVAGEAAAHADTWSVIARTHAAVNRRELPPTTPDPVYIDHRPFVSVEGVDLAASIRAVFDIHSAFTVYVEAVHRLTDLGAVVTHAAHGTSQEGFDAEWRMIDVFTVEGDLLSRVEVFDEADLDAALARFEELHPQTRRLKNAVMERFLAHFAARDWAGMAQDFAENYYFDDRRRVVNAGVYRGRDAAIEDLRVAVDIGLTTNVTVDIIATRGERCILAHWRASGPDPDPSQLDVLQVVEHDADERIAAAVIFDLDDIDAAFEELDARYLAGEAAAYSSIWSAVMHTYAAVNRREFSAKTLDWVGIDHRRVTAFGPGEWAAYVRSGWDLYQDFYVYVEGVHRLSSLGAVFTHGGYGTTQEDFDAEWRQVILLTFEGDLISRGEVFDEADLDTALARFDELDRPVRRLENEATRARERLADAINLRDVDRLLALTTADAQYEDRRKGLRDEGVARPEVVRAIFEVAPGGWRLDVAPIAIRGSRLALTRDTMRDNLDVELPITAEHLMVTEVTTDGLMRNSVLFDPDDIDAAFEELDARYLAGEAAAHSRTWSVIARASAGFNRRELPPMTPNPVYIDHRPLVGTEAVDIAAPLRDLWDLMPDVSVYIEAVHRLNELGAVVTETLKGTSQEGLDAEWRMINLFTIEGDLINRAEMFDEADLDAALARFDELQPQMPRLENAASQAYDRLNAYFARDWDAMAKLMADDFSVDDRRRLVGEGVPRGRDAQMVNMRAAADLGFTNVTSTVIATRGQRLVLARACCSGCDQGVELALVEVLCVVEINDVNRIAAIVVFDVDDIDSAFGELTARWIASGEVAHPEVIKTHYRFDETFNRHDWDAFAEMISDTTFVDHRQLAAGGADTVADHMPSIRTMASLVPDLRIEQAEILTHSAFGVVTYTVAKGTSTDGVAIELPLVVIVLVDGDRATRIEDFDPTQRDLALARFEEIGRR